jgi:hypothetical protein
MPIKPFYDTMDAVPENLRSFYAERDGRAVIDLEGGYEDTAGLKSAFSRTKTELATYKNRVRRFEEMGIDDPDKLATDLQDLERLRSIDPKSEAGKLADERIKSITEQIKTQHAKEIGKVSETASRYKARLEVHLIDNSAITALNEHKGNVRLLLPHVKSSARVVEDNGEFRVEVIDAAGNPRIGRKGDAMTIAEYVEEMRSSDAYAVAFAADNRQGTGHPPSGGTGSGRPGPGGKIRITPEQARSGKFINEIAAGKVEIVEQ